MCLETYHRLQLSIYLRFPCNKPFFMWVSASVIFSYDQLRHLMKNKNICDPIWSRAKSFWQWEIPSLIVLITIIIYLRCFGNFSATTTQFLLWECSWINKSCCPCYLTCHILSLFFFFFPKW
jgi:hypothetical protein